MKIKRIMMVVMIAMIALSTQSNISMSGQAAIPAVTSVYNRVVFAIDVSGSMATDDPHGIASILPQIFVDFAVSTNTEVGFVAFNNTIVNSHPLTSLSSQVARDSIKAGIDGLRIGGGTDIGIGLNYAMNMFSGAANAPNNAHVRSAVVFLSVGEQTNGIVSGRTMEDALADEHEVLEMSISYGIPIYAVSISAAGNFDLTYMNNMASETGGRWYEINHISELPDLIEELFVDITGSAITRQNVIGIGEHQLVNIAIPYNHTNESNIMIWHNGSIRGAHGSYTDSISIANIAIQNFPRYASTRIINPTTSNLGVDFVADVGAEVSVFVLNHLGILPVIMMPENLASLYIPIEAALFRVGETAHITYEQYYEGLTAQLIARNSLTGQETVTVLENTGAGFEGIFSNTSPGQQMELRVHISGESYYATSIPVTMTFTNTPPSVSQSAIPDMLRRRNNTASIDLNDFFYDIDGDILAYQIVGEVPEIVTLQDNILTMDLSTRGSESFLIQVSDGRGEVMEHSLSFEIVPWWIYYQMAILITALIFFILLSAYLAFIRGVKRAEAIPVTVLAPIPTSSYRFSGAKFEGYFLSTLSGNDIPILNWNAGYIENKHKISLGEMFSMLDVEERLPEAHKIFFEAGNNNAVIFYHSTSCVISIGNRDVPKGKKEVLIYEDKLYIVFEDHSTEIEIRYKRVKKLTRAGAFG